MRLLHTVCAALLTAVPVLAQGNQSIVFCGRFPFVSLDQANEPANTGGSINALAEFAMSRVTPGNGAVARSWIPATAMQAYVGDPGATGSYTFFDGFKTYFQRINFAGVFVKDADQAGGDPRKVYWTVRDVDANVDFQFFDQNAQQTATILPGDFFRFEENGNLEFFCTQAQFATAAGTQSGSASHGASAMCQDAAGNLYYSPAEGGHWVNGNTGGAQFANDGAICMIPNSAITYDAVGNVQSLAADSAILLFEEVSGSPSIRDMVQTNAGAFRNDGSPIDGSGFAQTTSNLIGLDFDPAGGTITSAFQDVNGRNIQMPNMVFAFDQGTWGGTIFTTGPNGVGQPGAIAKINGVKCGSDVSGVPADGSWLGVMLDTGNFQPTLMGLQIIPEPTTAPLVCDIPDLGALAPSASDLFIEFHGTAGSGVFLLLQFVTLPPATPGLVAPSLDFGLLFGPSSWNTVFTIPNAILLSPITAFVGTTDANGYLTFKVPNPNTPAVTGAAFVIHGLGVAGMVATVSNPVQWQYK